MKTLIVISVIFSVISALCLGLYKENETLRVELKAASKSECKPILQSDGWKHAI